MYMYMHIYKRCNDIIHTYLCTHTYDIYIDPWLPMSGRRRSLAGSERGPQQLGVGCHRWLHGAPGVVEIPKNHRKTIGKP